MTTVKISALRGTGGGSDISVVGPTTVLSGSSNTYTITDYDDFSVYDVSVSEGSVSRTDEVITLIAPTGSSEPVVILSVTRNASTRVFQIGLDGAGVATPSIVSPSNGSTNISTSVTLQATPFSTVPVGAGTHDASVWEVARDAGFTDIVDSDTITSGNLTQYTVSDLPRNTVLYSRVKYQSSVGDSAWSSTISFTTTNQQINKPTITIIGNSYDVGETPTFNSSAFSVTPTGSDTHVASTWVIRDADTDAVVWQLVGSSSNKLAVTIPVGVLQEDTLYTAEVQHIGGFGFSVFSDKLTFQTAQSFIPNTPGTPFGGGYYAGRISSGGQIYALVVAPKSLGGESTGTLAWKTSGTTTAGAYFWDNGWANTQAMATAGLANHPAAQFCRGLSIGGYSDWYLPAKDELEILYRNFKPTTTANTLSSGANSNSVPPRGNYTFDNPAQTSNALFKAGGAEAFLAEAYWSSTENGPNTVWFQVFFTGVVQNNATKTDVIYVRAVRRVPI